MFVLIEVPPERLSLFMCVLQRVTCQVHAKAPDLATIANAAEDLELRRSLARRNPALDDTQEIVIDAAKDAADLRAIEDAATGASWFEVDGGDPLAEVK